MSRGLWLAFPGWSRRAYPHCRRPICASRCCCARPATTPASILFVSTVRAVWPRRRRRFLPAIKLAIEYLDARGLDGMARKYRVMFIDGALYPLHLAISPDWKVHYFTAAMAAEPAHRAEEQRFLDDMRAVLGPIAMAALGQIQATLGLDYAGVDFGLAQNGSLLLFEANATMVINPPDADPMWDYRRPAIAAALVAARRMVARLAASEP
jgi:hypothetical protein